MCPGGRLYLAHLSHSEVPMVLARREWLQSVSRGCNDIEFRKREDHDTGQASPITPARVPVPSTAPATHPFIGGDAFAGQDNPYTQQNVTASSSSNPFGPFSSPSLAMSPAVTRAGISDSSLSFTGIVSMDFVIYVTTLHFEYASASLKPC